jgi:uncharacterized damage-inducible protein DinB
MVYLKLKSGNNRKEFYMRPLVNEYAPYYKRYVDLVEGNEIVPVLESQINDFLSLMETIPEEQKAYSYAEGKWTIAELLGHIIDTERIMSFRAFWFARNDPTPLPGFEQDDYVKVAGFNNRTLLSIVEEWVQLRKSNIILIKTFDKDALHRRGVANYNQVTVQALLFIIAGHCTHHLSVLKEKYLDK